MQEPSFSVPLFSHFRGAIVVTVVVVAVVVVAVVVAVVVVLGEKMFAVVFGTVNGVGVEVVVAVKLIMGGADVMEVLEMSAFEKVVVEKSLAMEVVVE